MGKEDKDEKVKFQCYVKRSVAEGIESLCNKAPLGDGVEAMYENCKRTEGFAPFGVNVNRDNDEQA